MQGNCFVRILVEALKGLVQTTWNKCQELARGEKIQITPQRIRNSVERQADSKGVEDLVKDRAN